MSTRYKYWYAVLLATFIFGACKKEQFKDALYVTGTETNPVTIMTAEEGITSKIALSITASGLVANDINVEFKTDPALVAAYNKEHGKNYLPVPDGDYELSGSSVVIKKGTNVSNALEFRVKTIRNFKPGSSYMMAVTMTNATGDLKVLESSRTIYYVVKPVVIQAVASLSGGTAFKPDFSETNAARLTNLSAVTIETRIFVNKFAASSPFISSVMGIEEHFLLRFGDVTIKPNQIQRAGMLALTAAKEFGTGTWYHIALVHDVSTTKLYINGILEASIADANNINILQPLGGGAYSTGFLIGTSAGSRYLDGMISESRLWSRALSQTEIIDGMCGVDPTSPGLEAYWKFNEGAGNVATDLSGHGHHATANRNVTWVPNVRCE